MVFLMNQVEGDQYGNAAEIAPLGLPHGPNAAGAPAQGTQKFVNRPSYRGLRTKTHTYAVALTGRWLLYNNEADPYQLNNLIHDPAQKPLMEKFDAAIMAWMKQVGDSFPFKENIKRYSDFPS